MVKTTYIADVQTALDSLKAAVIVNPKLEAEFEKKLTAAVELLTPKSTVTATFKRLQGLALSDFLVNMDKKTVGYTEETRKEKIKSYVHSKFQKHMDNSKTSKEATTLFNDAYPPEPAINADEAA